MKQLTCKQMGGPCDAVITGNSMDEMAKNGMAHLNSMTDDAHKQAIAGMANMTDDDNKKWMEQMQPMFDAAPDA